MKIFVTGASGMLADEIIPVLLKEGHEVIKTDKNRRLEDIIAMDVSDRKDVLIKIGEASPDYVFHLAAETNVDKCQEDPDHAFEINTIGTENIAVACSKTGSKLLYISTGAVFSGEKGKPYNEDDETGPVSVYGESKLRGETKVKELLTDFFIVRAGWMVGGWDLDKKFVYKIVQQLREGKKELKAVSDKFGSPTFTRDFASNILNVIKSGKYGTYHLTNKGSCSRYDMAKRIVEYMGLEDEVEVNPVGSEEFPLPAPRPRSAVMYNHNLELMGLNNMPRWEDSLERYIKENKDK